MVCSRDCIDFLQPFDEDDSGSGLGDDTSGIGSGDDTSGSGLGDDVSGSGDYTMDADTYGGALCGWDSRVNLCLTGHNTTVDERQALLEVYPGACSLYTGAPSVAPSWLPSATTPTSPPSQAEIVLLTTPAGGFIELGRGSEEPPSSSEKDATSSFNGEMTLLLIIPLLACGFVWRKPPASRARKATAFDVEHGEDFFQPISVRGDAVKVEMVQDENVAFDDLIGFLADVGEPLAPMIVEEVIQTRSVEHAAAHAVLSKASLVAPDRPGRPEEDETAVVDEDEVTLTKSLFAPGRERRPSFITRSESYNDLLNVAELHDNDLLNAVEIEAPLPWSSAMVHRSRLAFPEDLRDAADHGDTGSTVMPVPIGMATLERSSSYHDYLSPSDATADQQATLRSTREANEPALFDLDDEVGDAFGRTSLIFGGDGTAIRFKSVHRQNPLLAMAEVNLEAELEELELHNPTYNDTATLPAMRGGQQGTDGVILRATARNSNIRTASLCYNLDEHDDDADLPFVLGTVSKASQSTQEWSLPCDAPDAHDGLLAGDASGRGAHLPEDNDQDEYLAVNANSVFHAKRAAQPQRNNVDADEQEEYMAIVASGRAANLPDEDDQDGYLAFNDPVIGTATRATTVPNTGEEDDQDEYLALDASGRAANLPDEDDQDGYLAFNAPVIRTATRGGGRPATNDSSSYMAFDPSRTPLPMDPEMSAYLSEEEEEVYALASSFTRKRVNEFDVQPPTQPVDGAPNRPGSGVVVVDGIEHRIQRRMSPPKFPSQPPPPSPPPGGIDGLSTTEDSMLPMLSPEAARQLDAEAIALARRPPKVHPELSPSSHNENIYDNVYRGDELPAAMFGNRHSEHTQPAEGSLFWSNSKFDMLDDTDLADAAMLDDDDTEMHMTIRDLKKTAAPSAAMFAPAGRKMFGRPSGKKFNEKLTNFAAKRSPPKALAKDTTEENVFVRDVHNKKSLRLVSVRRQRADPSVVRVEPATIEDTTNMDDTTGRKSNTNRAKFAKAKKRSKVAPPSSFRGASPQFAATADGGGGDGNVFVRDPHNRKSLRLVSIKRKQGAARLAPAEIKAETADHESTGDSDSDDSQGTAEV